jgi:ATP-binding cassette subfamily B protein
VALVGLNGAGKSTIVKLLCRFYDPERGEISWDGVDLRDMDPAALRRRIGVVFQDFMSYDMTAAENIGVGDLDRIGDRAAVTAAARRAGAHDSVARLPRGYDTPVSRTFLFGANGGEDAGVTLSGGQWQRVALARALLRDQVDLVVLDEPSSGLDPDAEYAVHATLAEHRAGRTSVLISHRLNTVRDAEQIVVLRDGVVVERGSHDDLLRGDGGYARLFRLQARGYAATEPAGARLRPALPTGGS